MKENFIKYISSFIIAHTIEERKSEVSGRVEVLYTNGKYVLDSEHVNYSFGGLHTVFQNSFGQFRIRERKINNVLILGFGSGSAASILQDEYGKNLEIVGVEKDSEVIALAKKYFSIGKYKNLSLHNEDAFEFAENCKQKFDLVVMDVFIDRDVPDKFFTEKYISSLGNLLSGSGILFYNLVMHNEKVRNKGAQLFKLMNSIIGKTEWCRIFAQQTENWVFVCDKTKKA